MGSAFKKGVLNLDVSPPPPKRSGSGGCADKAPGLCRGKTPASPWCKNSKINAAKCARSCGACPAAPPPPAYAGKIPDHCPNGEHHTILGCVHDEASTAAPVAAATLPGGDALLLHPHELTPAAHEPFATRDATTPERPQPTVQPPTPTAAFTADDGSTAAFDELRAELSRTRDAATIAAARAEAAEKEAAAAEQTAEAAREEATAAKGAALAAGAAKPAPSPTDGGFADIAAQVAALPPAAVHAVAAFLVVACCCGVLECRRRSRTARLRRAAGEKQTLIHGGIALPVAKPTPRTAVRAPKARSKKKARARDHYDEDDDGMDGMSGVGV